MSSLHANQFNGVKILDWTACKTQVERIICWVIKSKAYFRVGCNYHNLMIGIILPLMPQDI